jgi:hypothetical protein
MAILRQRTPEPKLPVHAVGVGETAEDMRPFDADFAKDLMGVQLTGLALQTTPDLC